MQLRAVYYCRDFKLNSLIERKLLWGVSQLLTLQCGVTQQSKTIQINNHTNNIYLSCVSS